MKTIAERVHEIGGKENIEKAHILEAIQYRSLDKKYSV